MASDSIKDAINQRFIEAINLLVQRKLFSSPRDYGLKFDIKASTISDFKYGRSHVDVRHIYNIVSAYRFLSLDYIILGEGSLERKDVQLINIPEDVGKNSPLPSSSIEDLVKRIEYLEKALKNNQEGK